jgi:hypothetical protein
VELIMGHPETKASHSRSACEVTSRLWKKTERGLICRRAVLFVLAC